jgi:tetratricopeptide (TPR) repeat protein
MLGQYEKAVEQARRAIGLNPDVPFAYVNLATALQFLGRYEEAEAVYRQMSARKLEIPDGLVQQYQLGFLRDDKAEMEREVALCQTKCPGISAHEGYVLAYSGRLKQARAMQQRAVDGAKQAAHREREALFETAAALSDAFSGNVPEARRGAVAALELARGRDVEYGAGLALALSGDSVRAQSLANDLGKRFPEDTSVQFSYLPVLNAFLALKNDPAKAVKLLEDAVPYELGVPECWFVGFGALYPVYVRGEAYLAAHRGTEAAAEFRKILDHRGIVAYDPIGALAHVELGRAFVLSGNAAGAKAAYQDFLTLWNDADPDIPVLKEARAEYARLP